MASETDRAVIARLTGGLGNQMFQYAAAIALGERIDAEVRLDLGWFEHTQREAYRLHALEVSAQPADLQQLARIYDGEWRGARDWIRRRFAAMGMLPASNDVIAVFEERLSAERLLHLPPGSYHLTGIWQFPDIVSAARSRLQEEFRLREPLSRSAEAWRRRIEGRNSVLIHIRRCDYTSPQYLENIHQLGADYYQRAIDMVRSSLSNPNFIVFSDDPALIRETMPIFQDYEFMDDLSLAPHEVLALMKGCEQFIIANSTLSWWAAWLSGKPTISPSRWFRTQDRSWNNLSAPDWMQIEA